MLPMRRIRRDGCTGATPRRLGARVRDLQRERFRREWASCRRCMLELGLAAELLRVSVNGQPESWVIER